MINKVTLIYYGRVSSSSNTKVAAKTSIQTSQKLLPRANRKRASRYKLVSDIERFKVYDLEDNQQYVFKLSQLVDHVHLFG
jgi:hypothetical protein